MRIQTAAALPRRFFRARICNRKKAVALERKQKRPGLTGLSSSTSHQCQYIRGQRESGIRSQNAEELLTVRQRHSTPKKGNGPRHFGSRLDTGCMT
jgi:hypothetical protein